MTNVRHFIWSLMRLTVTKTLNLLYITAIVSIEVI